MLPMKNYYLKKGAEYISFWQRKIHVRLFAILLIFISSVNYGYSQNTKTVSGKITDEQKDPIIGASIAVENSTIGAITDENGDFILNVPTNTQKVKISFIGFIPQILDISGKTTLNVTLKEDLQVLEEIVVVGYGTQKKATLTGSVAAIDNKDLVATKNQNVQNMMTGKVPGVRVIQKTSEPGEFNNQFDIRGFGNPLVVVDGIPRDNFTRLDPNEIESISILKDASAAVYGVRAANGVVLITTKKGSDGKTKIDYSFNYGIQKPVEQQKPVGAVDRMTLFNERNRRSSGLNGDAVDIYFDKDFEEYYNGTRQSTDWYDAVLKSTAPQYQHNVSASGNVANKMGYFVNFGYTNQRGFLKADDLEYERYNLRVNLDAQLSKDFKMSVKLNGIIDSKKSQSTDTWQIFKTLWRQIPNEPLYANNTAPYYMKVNNDLNPLAASSADVTGYKKNDNKWIQSSFELEYNVPYVEGLSAKGLFSYDMRFYDNSTFTKEYNVYTYDGTNDVYTPFKMNYPERLYRYYASTPSHLWQVALNYDRLFSQKHQIKALLLYEESRNTGDNFFAQRNLAISIPYLYAGVSKDQLGNSNIDGIYENANKGLVGKFNYDFMGKYLAEFSFRYDGSSKFPKDGRWGFFPAGAIGWRVSEESFIKSNSSLSFIDNLKVRASYGKMGDDGASSYQFIPGYNYPYNGDRQALGGGYVFDGQFVPAIEYRPYPNYYITWYTVKTLNLGLDLDMWKGLLGVSFDVFRRDRDGLLADRAVSLPGSFGSAMAQENLNSDQTQGIELALSHKNRIGDFGYSLIGNMSLTRTKNKYVEGSPFGNSYKNWRDNKNNRYNDIWFGWGDNGRYQSYEQIANYPVFTGRETLPGDYIYEDWNGDGVIDDMDRYPIATTTDASKADFQDKRNYPLMNFGLTIMADYKGFDINMLFQGAAMSYVSYGEQFREPLAWNGNALDMFMDRWHPVDPKADPYDSSTKWTSGHFAYTGSNADDNSRFRIQDGAYLRLKSIELGYSLPKKIVSKVGIQNLRIYTNAYNLFTITGVKGLDPEHPTELYGYMYPLNKTFNFGVNVSF